MKYYLSKKLVWLSLAACLVFSGCNNNADNRPEVTVAGKVTFQGKPIEKGSIQFSSSKTREGYVGTLGADGSYEVTITKADLDVKYDITVGPPVVELDDAFAASEKPLPVMETNIPKKYSDMMTSGLSITFKTKGTLEHNIELE